MSSLALFDPPSSLLSSSAPISPPAHTSGLVAAKRNQTQAAKATEAKSWGEALQKYQTVRLSPAHPDLLHPAPVSKHGVFNEKIKPAEFNPVRGVYNNPQREQETKTNEAEKSAAQLQHAQWKYDHLANHKPYNILSGTMKPSTNKEVVEAIIRKDENHRTKVYEKDGKRVISFQQVPYHPPTRDYNILTNKVAFEGGAERLAKAEAVFTPLHNRSVKEAREYNILTNRYQYENHVARFERERIANEAKLREKYFANSHYNPVTLQFVHPDEEKRFIEKKAAADAIHGQRQLRNLPPNIKSSEGNCYVITSPTVIKNAETLEQKEQQAAGKLTRRKEKYVFERELRERGFKADDTNALRTNNRVAAAKRAEIEIERGHDIVTNESYEGRGSKRIFKPQATIKKFESQPEIKPAGKVSKYI